MFYHLQNLFLGVFGLGGLCLRVFVGGFMSGGFLSCHRDKYEQIMLSYLLTVNCNIRKMSKSFELVTI